MQNSRNNIKDGRKNYRENNHKVRYWGDIKANDTTRGIQKRILLLTKVSFKMQNKDPRQKIIRHSYSCLPYSYSSSQQYKKIFSKSF